MSENTNSARRLLALILSAKQKAENKSAATVWAEVFGLDPQVAEKDPHEVQVRLKAMRDEVDKLERQMRESAFSPDLYVGYLGNIRRVVTVANLAAGWSNYSGSVREDTLLALRYCAEIVPAEIGIAHEELQSILDKINEFRGELETADLPASARQFLLDQLNIMEKGIQDYPIKGGEAVRTAFKAGFSEVVMTEADLATGDAPPKVSKLAKLWRGLQTAANGITEVDKAAIALSHLLEKGPALLEGITKMLPSG